MFLLQAALVNVKIPVVEDDQVPVTVAVNSDDITAVAGDKEEVEQEKQFTIPRTEDNEAELSLASGVSDMFPSTPVDYIRWRCRDLVGRQEATDKFVLELVDNPHPPPDWRTGPSWSQAGPSCSGAATSCEQLTPVQVWERERGEQLQSMFPLLCPDYLRDRVEAIATTEELKRNVVGVHSVKFQQLVESLWTPALTLPSRKQWEARQREKQELDKWANQMTASRFLELYSDPKSYFSDTNRVSSESSGYRQHAIADLMARFPFQSKAKVLAALKKHKLYLTTVKFLQGQQNTRKTKRTRYEIEVETPRQICIEFLKEKKYLELEDRIAQLRQQKILQREAKMTAARKEGLLLECPCCCSEDCLEEEMVHCSAGHAYCKECVSRAATVTMGDNKTAVECLGQCRQEIHWQQLARALDPVLLSKLLQNRQAEEVNEAGLEGLVSCPFCPYQTVMEGEADKVLVCRNPDCGRESCRQCRETNHVPRRCDEVEKTEGVRKEIEEKLTLAMIRKCWKCNNKVTIFIPT